MKLIEDFVSRIPEMDWLRKTIHPLNDFAGLSGQNAADPKIGREGPELHRHELAILTALEDQDAVERAIRQFSIAGTEQPDDISAKDI